MVVITYAFDITLALSAWFAGHHPENAASRKVLARFAQVHDKNNFIRLNLVEARSYLLKRFPADHL